jgi:hypothetical protein
MGNLPETTADPYRDISGASVLARAMDVSFCIHFQVHRQNMIPAVQTYTDNIYDS